MPKRDLHEGGIRRGNRGSRNLMGGGREKKRKQQFRGLKGKQSCAGEGKKEIDELAKTQELTSKGEKAATAPPERSATEGEIHGKLQRKEACSHREEGNLFKKCTFLSRRFFPF